jgi:hypothetical protein
MFSKLLNGVSSSFSVVSPKKIGFDDVLFAMLSPPLRGSATLHRPLPTSSSAVSLIGGLAHSGGGGRFIIINTLPSTEQSVLIKGTLPFSEEEELINCMIDRGELKTVIFIIYGKNSVDTTVERKYNQLKTFGFVDVYIYYGGLFEWALLREIYGGDMFETVDSGNDATMDLLKWKPPCVFTKR